jgi:hypothetical protein
MTVTVKTPPPAMSEITCRGCRAVLGFELGVEDLTPGYFDGDYTETGPKGVGVKCPVCSTLTQVRPAPDALINAVWARRGSR